MQAVAGIAGPGHSCSKGAKTHRQNWIRWNEQRTSKQELHHFLHAPTV